MKTFLCLFLLLISSGSLFSQSVQFEEYDTLSTTFVANSIFPAYTSSIIRYSDLDGDGDLDLVLGGVISHPYGQTDVYFNNGYGKFTKDQFNALPGTEGADSDIICEDFNGDGNNDIVLCQSSNNQVGLWINNGSGQFSQVNANYLDSTYAYRLASGDLDLDGDIDLITLSQNSSSILFNDGNGSFAQPIIFDTTFVYNGGTVECGDLDNDGYLDILFSVRPFGTPYQIALYMNDGTGTFLVDSTQQIEPFISGEAIITDFNNDGLNDIVTTGIHESAPYYYYWGSATNVYYGIIGGGFERDTLSSFFGLQRGEIDVSDIDGDGDQDILISGGYYNSIEKVTKLYINQNGSFIESASFSQTVTAVSRTDVALFDANGDGKDDLLLSGGFGIGSMRDIFFYVNHGNYEFERVKKRNFGLYNGETRLSDIDSDGDLDLFVTGESHLKRLIAHFYENDGAGNFSENISNNLEGLRKSTCDFGDIDNDGDPDLFYCGADENNSPKSFLYKNDGQGNYLIVNQSTLPNLKNGRAQFFDSNNDGDIDLFLTGEDSLGNVLANVYMNNGNLTFSPLSNPSFPTLFNANFDIGDLNMDGYLDIALTGNSLTGGSSHVFMNNQGTGFIETPSSIPDVENGSISLGDINSDGNLDVIVSGWDGNDTITQAFMNDGAANFSNSQWNLIGVVNGASKFIDVNTDGNQDLILMGTNADGLKITRLYLYTPTNNQLTLYPYEFFTPVDNGGISIGDLDGDGDSDAIINGVNDLLSPYGTIKLYRNNSIDVSLNLPDFKDERLILYPNPSGKGKVQLLGGEDLASSYIVRNYVGDVLKRGDVVNNEIVHNIQIPGLYFISILMNDVWHTIPMVVI